jgi:MerR family transcriptional regulator, aldehyde-responsive regulator
MTIAQVADQFDVSVDTLRYYERIGLIPPVRRTGGGQRDYSENDLRWVEFIKCMRGAGVSIETLAEYVALFQKGKESIQARKALLLAQRQQIADRIAELAAAQARLDKKLDGYEERMLKIEENLYRSPD